MKCFPFWKDRGPHSPSKLWLEFFPGGSPGVRGTGADPGPKGSAAVLCSEQTGYSQVGRAAGLPLQPGLVFSRPLAELWALSHLWSCRGDFSYQSVVTPSSSGQSFPKGGPENLCFISKSPAEAEARKRVPGDFNQPSSGFFCTLKHENLSFRGFF